MPSVSGQSCESVRGCEEEGAADPKVDIARETTSVGTADGMQAPPAPEVEVKVSAACRDPSPAPDPEVASLTAHASYPFGACTDSPCPLNTHDLP